MKMEKTLLLSKQEIDDMLTMKDILDAVDKTFVGLGDGTVVNPTKVTLDLRGDVPGYDGYINAMPAYVSWVNMAGLKWAGGWHNRPDLGLPFISSMIFLIDPENGNFKAVMDGEHITTLRTGAQAVIATTYFRKGLGSDLSIGLFGCGAQGHMQTKAFSEIYNITELRVYDLYKEAALKFKEEMKDYVDGEIIVCDTPEEVAATQPNVLVSFTHGDNKFITDGMVHPGQIVFPMGSFTEASDELLLNADKIIVDHMAQCLHRGALSDVAAQGKSSEKDVYCTIGDVAAENMDIGDLSTQRIVCVPIGTGCMDIAVASIAYQRAVAKGIGGEYMFG